MFLRIFILITCFLPVLGVFTQNANLTLQIGHSLDVTSLDFDNTGKILVSGGFDNNMKIWDISTGCLIRSLYGHSNAVTSVKVTPDNDFIASGSLDCTIKLWEVKTGKLVRAFIDARQGISSVCFSPNGKMVAAGCWDNNIYIWETATARLVKIIPAHENRVISIDFGDDNQTVVSSDMNGVIKKWNILSGKELWTNNKHTDCVTKIRFSNDNKYVVSCSNDKTLNITDAETGKLKHTLKYAMDIDLQPVQIYDAVFSSDNKSVIGTIKTGKIAVWEVSTGNMIQSFDAGAYNAGALDIAPAGNILAIAEDHSIRIIDRQSQSTVYLLKSVSSMVNSVDFSDNNNFIATGNTDNTVKIWDFETGRMVKNISYHSGRVETVCFHPKERLVLSAGSDSVIYLCNVENGEIIHKYFTEDIVNSLSFRIDGKYFASGGNDMIVKYFKTETGEQVRSFTGHRKMVHCVKVSPDGKFISSGSWDKTMKIWNIENNEMVNELTGQDGDIWSLDYNADGTKLASGGSDGKVIIYNLPSGEIFKTLKLHTDYVKCVSFSPDGKTIASGSWDKTIKISDVETGHLLHTLTGHQNYVRSIVYSPDGKYLLSGSSDNRAKLWETSKGKELLDFIAFNNSNDYVITSPAGYFDGTTEGIKHALHYVKDNEVIPLESFHECFYTPGLWARIIAGERFDNPDIDIQNMKYPPLVFIRIPKNDSIQFENGACLSKSGEIILEIQTIDTGGGIDEICLYHNGKMIENTTRAFIPVRNKCKEHISKYTVKLVNGQNLFSAVAYNSERTGSIPVTETVYFNGYTPSPDLYIVSIGINEYLNASQNLNFAQTDAIAFNNSIKKGSSGIFKKIHSYLLLNEQAVKSRVMETFDEITRKAVQHDVFILYFAGHGVMSISEEGESSEFYIVPHDVTQLYGNNASLKEKAVSSSELVGLSVNIKARKQLFVFDACQSGGLINDFALRGTTEQKAIVQLARSAGISILASSGSDQYASEFKELQHGVFTYTLLEGLDGKADGGNKDGKITVSELKAYIENNVPEMTVKYRGQAQYPTGYSRGQDFPVVVY